jgi:chemotaxis protein methyltransferase CheR
MSSTPPPIEPRVREPDDREFALIRELVAREVGIHLHEGKRALVYGRLARRLRELGLETFGEYYARVVGPKGMVRDRDELVALIDRITTNETAFFREPQHFAYLEEVVFPEWRAQARAGERPRRVRAWSAGCSSGEEPYSLAMMLWHHLPRSEGWSFDVLATDISTRILRTAADAIYPLARAAPISEEMRMRYMLRGIGSRAGTLRVAPELRAQVRFERLNLNGDAYPTGGPFDLVFCRNVLIYFDGPRKQRVVRELSARLAPEGLLFVGHAESVSSFGGNLVALRPNVYAPRRTGAT